MKVTTVLAGSLALAVSVGTAAHAEPFNGPFLGVQAGWSQDDIGTAETQFGDISMDQSHDTFTGGFFAGYDFKVSPRFVIGAEAGMTFGADDSLTRLDNASHIKMDPKRSIDLTARAGYLANDKTLVYVRGGYTNARLKTTVTDGASRASDSKNHDGWLVGGGVEYAVMKNVSARLEYRYSDFSDGDYDRHQVLFGVSYRF